MKIPLFLEPLFNQAWAYVRRCIEAEGSFLPFAFAVGQDGKVLPFQLDKPQEISVAISALLKNLIPLIASGDIVATVICTPMPPEATLYKVATVVFDLEHKSKQRILAVMQLRKSERHGWNFGPIEYRNDKPKLFPT